MNPKLLTSYLERTREIIGDRTESEARYDDAVVTGLLNKLTIQEAIAAANEQFVEEALLPADDQWDVVQERYEYIMEHKSILMKLGLKE